MTIRKLRMPALWLGFGPLLLFCLATIASAQLKLDSKGLVILQGGTGSIEITLTTPGAAAVPLALKFGVFKDKISQAALTAPKVTFALESGGELPKTIDSAHPAQLEAKITDFAGSSDAEVSLYNDTVALGNLEVVALDSPLNISIDGDGATSDKPLAFTRKEVSITLKNADAVTYPIQWEFQIAGTQCNSGETILASHRSQRIVITPACSLFSLGDWVHPNAQKGLLLVQMKAPAQISKELLPVQSLAVSLKMMPADASTTEVLSYIYVTIFLLVGGIISILASSVLPNILRKVSLRRQVGDLADRTTSVSTRVDSYLRVLLRLERKKIDILLTSVKLYSLTIADTLDDASTAIDKLTQRVAIAEQLDELRRALEAASETAPPSIVDDVDTKLQLAANQLHAFALPDENVKTAKDFLDQANTSLGVLENPGALAKLISEKFTSLTTRFNEVPADIYADLREALPGIFSIIGKDFDNPANITPEMAFAIDHAVSAIQIVFDYAMVRISLPAAPTINCPGDPPRAKQLAHECDLIAFLGTMSWQALYEARILVREMRENIYEQDVLDEIGREGQAEVVFDTQKARPYLPVYFTISFKDPRFNTAAAIEHLSCKWDFPGPLEEHSWKVCHFFSGTEPGLVDHKATINASIQSQRVTNGARSLSKTIEIQPEKPPAEYSRVIAELMRFLIAFGVALAALLSGALSQLQKLDFLPATLAIIGLGFGADSIKNLLTQPAKKTDAKPA